MGKIRVHNLASELGIHSNDMIKELLNLGYSVKNSMSTVDMGEVIRIRESILNKAKEKEQEQELAKKELKSEPAVQISIVDADKVESKTDQALVTEAKLEEGINEVVEGPEVIKVNENSYLKDLADKLEYTPNELLKALLGEGVIATINQAIDENITRAVEKIYNKKIEITFYEDKAYEEDEIIEEKENPEDYVPRPPIATIMGHVDHGKTTLLDAIRESNIASKEAGGITQHIGAYKVEHEKGLVVFLDTPGHEAFTAMRARGARVTDIVVLVVAADDGIMPQTIEAIHHARAGDVPIIVAINKIDKPDINIERIKTDLTQHQLVPEEWGGKTIFVEVSAKNKIGLEHLMEMILLQAEVMELKGNPKGMGKGTIIESRLDVGKGAVATVIIQKGIIKSGDAFVAGKTHGKIRALINDNRKKIKCAEISTPVEIIGFSSVPEAGDSFVLVKSEKYARQIAAVRMQKNKERFLKKASPRVTLEDLRNQIDKGQIKELNVVVKADVDGSVQAITDSLGKIGSDEVRMKVIHGSVGGITESDVLLSAASNAVIIGFNVRPTEKASVLADNEKIELKLYTVIYDVINDFKSALEGLLKPKLVEKRLGRAEVREVISVPRVGYICGCFVLDGLIKRNSEARLVRDNIVIYEGKIASLRRFKEDVKEVQSGFECGITLENFQDIKQNDIIEPFYIEEISRKL